MSKELQMTFDPHTIEHLGIRMYTTLPPVLAELIANAYDADAENVSLTLKDEGNEKEIIVEDDGIGMSFKEINKKFLRIGQNRRNIDGNTTPIKNRKIIGKKGLGKLSFFGIAPEVEITTRKEGKETVFVMSWEKIKNTQQGQNYTPTIKKSEVPCSRQEKTGTKIVLRKIQRKTSFDSMRLAVSLSKIFILSNDFKITIKHNEENPLTVTNQMRYEDMETECEWKFPLPEYSQHNYNKASEIKGYLITTKKPIKPSTNMRGVILFSRNKLVNNPEYFSDSTSSHFFSYLTGHLEVDFIDDLEDDVIATNRQSLNWNHEEIRKLREYLKGLVNFLQTDWRNKRKDKRNTNLKERTGIDIPGWFAKLPEEYSIKSSVESIVRRLIEDSELSEEMQQETVKKIHGLIPEYPKYHWRHLHPEIRNASKEKYERQDYYGAFREAVKRYVNKISEKSGIQKSSDRALMNEVFSKDNPRLTVTDNFKKPDGSNFKEDTISNIEEGNRSLSVGIVAGCRNPITHEEETDLRDSGLFTEKDCLDALSLLSHLFRRLDSAKKK